MSSIENQDYSTEDLPLSMREAVEAFHKAPSVMEGINVMWDIVDLKDLQEDKPTSVVEPKHIEKQKEAILLSR